MAKISKEKWKTWGNVFDEFTFRTLFRLASQGHFDVLVSPVSIGKESNIFTAEGKKGRIIAKIYRLETADFNRMYDYIKLDPRFKIKKQHRKIIFTWTRREYRNLIRAREAGVSVPKPIAVLNNVLLLEFIGNQDIAPKLKDCPPKNKRQFLNKIIQNMKKLYKADLVHADLSQFNILNHHENPVFIDLSQTTTLKNPRAEEFLERDTTNISNFFNKLGLRTDAKILKTDIISK
jgi:RIO kinase 1